MNILSVKRAWSSTLSINEEVIKDCASLTTVLILDDVAVEIEKRGENSVSFAALTLFYGNSNKIAPFLCLSLGCALLKDKVIMTILIHEYLHIFKELKRETIKTKKNSMQEEVEMRLAEMEIYDCLGFDFKRAYIERELTLSETIRKWVAERDITPLPNKKFSELLVSSDVRLQDVNVIRVRK